MAIDAVCGASVNESVALVQAEFSTREGRYYFFCSMACKTEFDRNPQSYALKRDPVCGREIDAERAASAHLTAKYEGHPYYFCSAQCQAKFQQAPLSHLGEAQFPPGEQDNRHRMSE